MGTPQARRNRRRSGRHGDCREPGPSPERPCKEKNEGSGAEPFLGASYARPQPCHDDIKRRSPAARQTVALQGGHRKSGCLLSRLSVLTCK